MMKRLLGIIMVLAMIGILLTACGDTGFSGSSALTDATPSPTTISNSLDTDNLPIGGFPSTGDSPATENQSNTSSSNTNSSTSFTNKFGTATTTCAHSGCDNYIASSGDTNCCVTHSNKCLNCRKYIDEDAMYCMSCLTSAANDKASDGKSTSSDSMDSSSGTCKYKEGGNYVCSKPATNGNFCKQHYDYLNNAYTSLFGN